MSVPQSRSSKLNLAVDVISPGFLDGYSALWDRLAVQCDSRTRTWLDADLLLKFVLSVNSPNLILQVVCSNIRNGSLFDCYSPGTLPGLFQDSFRLPVRLIVVYQLCPHCSRAFVRLCTSHDLRWHRVARQLALPRFSSNRWRYCDSRTNSTFHGSCPP
jgi:hypothetical protein